eukprot:UN12895
MDELKVRYDEINIAALHMQFKEKCLMGNDGINVSGVCNGDTISWFVKESFKACKNDEKGDYKESKNNGLEKEEDEYDDDETESENEPIVNDNKDQESKAPTLDLMRRGEKGVNNNDTGDIIDLT